MTYVLSPTRLSPAPVPVKYTLVKENKSTSKPRVRAQEQKTSVAPQQPPASPPDAESPCPVVAFGASAGGLEAFQEILANLPEDTGMAYVFIQHLDPKHTSILGELLSKSTK